MKRIIAVLGLVATAPAFAGSFGDAAKVTEQIDCSNVPEAQRKACEDKVKSIAKQQKMLSIEGTASTVAAGAGVAGFAYSELGMDKPNASETTAANLDSNKKALEKLSKIQKMAGYAMVGAGGADLATGVYARTALTGQLNGIKKQGAEDDAAIKANNHAAMNSMMWGAGKAAAGYLLIKQADKAKKDADNLASAMPTDTNTSTSTNTSTNLASQDMHQGELFGTSTNTPTITSNAINIGTPPPSNRDATRASTSPTGASLAPPEDSGGGSPTLANSSGASNAPPSDAVTGIANPSVNMAKTGSASKPMAALPARIGASAPEVARDPASGGGSAAPGYLDSGLLSSAGANSGSSAASSGASVTTPQGVRAAAGESLFDSTTHKLQALAPSRL